nr:hypothetical protein [Thermoleophilaceae bacterium]
MRSVLLCAFGLFLAAGPAHARVLVVGDSLAVGSGPHLRSALGGEEVEVNARTGRPSPQAASILEGLVSDEDEVVVFDAGTNDDPSRPGVLRSSLRRAGDAAGDRCLVIATLVRPALNGVSVAGMNRAVESFAGGNEGVEVVDWAAAVKEDPGLVSGDGVHPDAAGYRKRGELFAGAVAACGVGGGGGGKGSDDDDTGTATTDDDQVAPDDSIPAPRRARRRPRRSRKLPSDLSGVLVTEPVRVGDGLAGELVLPAEDKPGPGVVFLHDGDTTSREAGRAEAEQLAARGVATLLYDRRKGGGYRDWAGDARAAASLLAKRPEIRKGGVALWGPGDGADVAALAAAGNPDVGAVVAASPSGLSPASREEWRVRRALEEAGAGAGDAAVSQLYGFLAAGDSDEAFDPVEKWRKVAQPVMA